MHRDINILKLTIYSLFTVSVLSNAALIFAEYYTLENEAWSLAVFILAIAVLIIGPTYYIAKTKWLQK